jgi:hypothetical protein
LQPDSLIPDPSNPQAWNRYSYVRNNPINFNDPTGHVRTQGCGDDGKAACKADPNTNEEARNAQHLGKLNHDVYDRKCAAGDKNYCSGVSKAKDDLIEIFTNTTIALDNISFGISLFEAAISDLAIAGSLLMGGPALPEVLLIDFALASPLNPLASIENGLGNISFGLTAASDILSGNTRVSSNNQLFIGKDTIVAGRNAILGNYPESNFDAVVNASQVKYDMDRLNGVRPGGSINVYDTSTLLGQIVWHDSPFQDLFNTFR